MPVRYFRVQMQSDVTEALDQLPGTTVKSVALDASTPTVAVIGTSLDLAALRRCFRKVLGLTVEETLKPA
jgi:hypothetical protein